MIIKQILICLLMLALLIPCGLCETEYDVAAAVEALKTYWRDEAYAFAEDQDGYLEIKNTRIVVIADEPKAENEDMQPQMDKCFADVDYIVEFILYSDMLGAAPYYQNAGSWNCVVVRKDGSMEVPAESPFDDYRSHTYSLDVSGIVADVIDLNQEYNAVYHLLEE